MWPRLQPVMRAWGRDPLWIAAIVLLLALAQASLLAAFAILDAVLLRSLPYSEAASLFALHDEYRIHSSMRFGVSEPELFDDRAGLERSAELAAFTTDHVNMSDGEPRRIPAAHVTANFFHVLGVQPEQGRSFTPDEDLPHAPLVVIVSRRLWLQRPAAATGGNGAGRPDLLTLDGKVYHIVGVLPDGFQLPVDLAGGGQTDVVFPLRLDSANLRERGNPVLDVLGRLRHGVTLHQAESEGRGLAARLQQLYPASYPLESGFRLRIVPLLDEIAGGARRPLAGVVAAAALVYLVALGNAGGMFLTRLERRRKELAVRQALGAPVRRLAGELFLEAGAVTILAGLPGLGLAYALCRTVLALGAGRHMPRLDTLSPDLPMTAFLCALLAVTALTLGLLAVPAALRREAMERTLREQGGGTTGSRRAQTFRALMLVGQVTFSCALLAGAVLLVASYRKLRQIDLGMRPQGVLLLDVSLPAAYDSQAKAARAFDEILMRVRGLPGVRDAGTLVFVPLVDQANIWPVGFDASGGASSSQFVAVDAQVVSEGSFGALGMTLRRGRDFSAADAAGGSIAAVISESLARQLWPGADPLGRRLRPLLRRHAGWAVVVGVVGDIRQNSLIGAPHPTLYVLHRQLPDLCDYLVGSMTVAIRTSVTPQTLIAPARRAVWSVEKAAPASSPRILATVVAGATWKDRFAMQIFSLLSTVGLGIAVLGLISFIVQLVAQRTREIAVRMAMGAGRAQIVSLIVGEGMRLTALGLAFGLAVALASDRLLAHLLYGLGEAHYVLVDLGVAAALALAAAAACVPPAWSGTRVPPALVMRQE